MTYNFVLNFKSFMVIQNYNIWLKYILMWKHKSKTPLIYNNLKGKASVQMHFKNHSIL